MATVFFGIIGAQDGCSAADKGLVVTQRGVTLGKSKMFFAKDKCRVDLLDAGLTTLFLPGSKVVIYNLPHRCYFETDIVHWRGFLGAQAEAFEDFDFTNMAWQVTTHDNIAGLPAVGAVLRNGANIDRTGRKFWFTTSLAVPDEWLKTLALRSQLPKFPGIPLRTLALKTVNPNTTFVTLDTLAVKEQELLPNTFDVPKGYKKVSKQEDAESSDAAQNLIQDLGDIIPSYERRKRQRAKQGAL